MASAIKEGIEAFGGYFALPSSSEVAVVDVEELVSQHYLERALDESDLGDMVLDSEL